MILSMTRHIPGCRQEFTILILKISEITKEYPKQYMDIMVAMGLRQH